MSFLEAVNHVTYLGPGGSYTEMAKDFFCEKFAIDSYQEPMKRIRRVIEFVDETPNSIGILPVENSIEGTVRETIDTLLMTKNQNIKFLAEYTMPIKHCLLSKTTELYSICGLISHPQAIAQCQNFIHNELPIHLDIIETVSTAEAARKLDEYNLTYAAIGSEKTADIYNLNILKENISDDMDNKTRFAIIGDFETFPTGKDVTTIAFSTANQSGALLEVLEIFKENHINLTYIDSRPSKTQFGEYTFFVDFEGHIKEEKVINVVKQITEKVKYYRLIGSYERM